MSFAILLLAISALAYTVGWIWLIVLAFQRGENYWGVGLILSGFIGVGPILAIVFIVLHWREARRPGMLLFSSMGLAVIGLVGLGLAVRGEASAMAREIREAVARGTNGLTITGTTEARPPTPVPVRPVPTVPSTAEPRTPAEGPARPVGKVASGTLPEAGANAGGPREESSSRPVRPEVSPVRVRLVRIGEAMPNEMRMMQVRIENDSTNAVREVKLALSYWDLRGNRVGGWTTVHSDGAQLVDGTATNEFEMRGFFVPQFTRQVRFGIDAVQFVDGTRWPKSP